MNIVTKLGPKPNTVIKFLRKERHFRFSKSRILRRSSTAKWDRTTKNSNTWMNTKKGYMFSKQVEKSFRSRSHICENSKKKSGSCIQYERNRRVENCWTGGDPERGIVTGESEQMRYIVFSGYSKVGECKKNKRRELTNWYWGEQVVKWDRGILLHER